MAKIDRMMVGESLVGDGNEVAHIDLIVGPQFRVAQRDKPWIVLRHAVDGARAHARH